MSDNRTAALPDGTDAVIEGAARTDEVGVATVEDTALANKRENPGSDGNSERTANDSNEPGSVPSAAGNIIERFRTGSEQLSSQAGERARDLVSQGLHRTADALANVSKAVGDSALGIEERLGADYGDYARRAAGAIENTANRIASKDPDELIDDTRNFVRESPGIALAGAAVVGFVIARLLKTGLAATRENEDDG